MTVVEYAELDVPGEVRTELRDGYVVRSPSTSPNDMNASGLLYYQLISQLASTEFEALLEVDVNLQPAPGRRPITVRRPDVVILRRGIRMIAHQERRMLHANEIAVAIEVLSPSSKDTDLKEKRVEYADAGIPRYWIVDFAAPVSLLPCHAAGEFGYRDEGEVTGVFETTAPVPLKVDLDALV